MEYRWVKDYKDLKKQINYLNWNLNRSTLELKRGEVGEIRSVNFENKNRLEELQQDIAKITSEIKRLKRDKQEMVRLIDTFEGVDNKIIKLKYIDGMTLEDVAQEIGYSISYVRKRNTEINKIIKFFDKKEMSKNS
ncbi:hypothetical protein ACFFIF_08045 [Vagococcus entomophilus]|uniref:RNA polymerase sigma-70 region 4 domain-containing protein n=1 Tax=Vagococcus entomophilus TaxID=1160095 RepID=A0A430AH63_9ENTE|nr:hypothetical protein [Vagococcus entomophilus]RSU07286.1 hypothetical protein CBF30_08520 [Vagococcus entomophilus]